MRKLIVNLLLFFGVIEGLARVDLFVLLTGVGVALAFVICTDLLLASASPR